jgi:hypothetical protein
LFEDFFQAFLNLLSANLLPIMQIRLVLTTKIVLKSSQKPELG